MPYLKQTMIHPVRPLRRGYRAVSGMGDFTDADQCSTIPIGDPYRKPGNYCATPDGGMTTFNADGSTYRAGGAVDPDPAHPAGSSSSGSSSSSSGSSILGAFLNALSPKPPTTVIAPGAGGISTTTMVALAGGAVLLVVLLSRR